MYSNEVIMVVNKQQHHVIEVPYVVFDRVVFVENKCEI